MLAAAPPVIDPSDPLAVVELKRQLQFAHLKIQLLEERLRLQRIQKYGPASEKLSNAQLELLEEEPGVSNLEVAAESAREPLPAVGAAPAQAHPQASWTSGITRESGAGGTSDPLRAGTVPLRPLRRADRSHRLRAERTTGRRAGQVLRVGDQARKARLPAAASGAW